MGNWGEILDFHVFLLFGTLGWNMVGRLKSMLVLSKIVMNQLFFYLYTTINPRNPCKHNYTNMTRLGILCVVFKRDASNYPKFKDENNGMNSITKPKHKLDPNL